MIKSKIKQLRKEGQSYNEISTKLRISKTYARKVAKNVKMSFEGEKRYYSRVKGILKRINSQESLGKKKIRIIGNLLFDGAVFKSNYHYVVSYVNTTQQMVILFIQDMQEVYGLTPSAIEMGKGKHHPFFRVKYCSKNLYDDLLNYVTSYSTADSKCKIKKEIINSKPRRLVVFLRTFWTNEGSVSDTGRLTADSKSKTIIKQLSTMHKNLGILHNVCSYSVGEYGTMYKLCLKISKENYLTFFNLNLFGDSIITKGKNIGKMKQTKLKEYMVSRNFI